MDVKTKALHTARRATIRTNELKAQLDRDNRYELIAQAVARIQTNK